MDEAGNVADVQVISGLADEPAFREAALEHARRRRYRPASKNGVPVRVWIPLNVKFDPPARRPGDF